MRDEDEVVRIETVGKRRVYSEADYNALRKHAEALVKALDNIGVSTDEDDILWTANHAIDNFRAAYPKEDT